MALRAIGGLILLTLALAGSLIDWPLGAKAIQITGQLRFITGDSAQIRQTTGHIDKIRLKGVDAPDQGQDCYTRQGDKFSCLPFILDTLSAEFDGDTVTCVGKRRDRFGRLEAFCRVGDIDIGDFIVRRGYGRAYLKQSREYLSAEISARQDKAGLWDGWWESPRVYRLRQTNAAKVID